MTEFLGYLVEVSISISVLYLVYYLFLNRTTFFALNRLYLMSSLVVSFMLPCMSLEVGYSQSITPYIEIFSVPAETVADDHAFSEALIDPGNDIKFVELLFGAYLLIAGYLFFRTLYKVFSLFRMRYGGELSPDGFRIITAGVKAPFSFYNTIFISAEANDAAILEHEKAHVRLRHWIDLLVVEVASVILWFNPVMIGVRRSVRIQHEYQADAQVLRSVQSLEGYLSCLLRQACPEHLSGPVSLFFSNPLKQRINMMTKHKTRWIFSLGYLSAVPIVLLLLSAFSMQEQPGLSEPAHASGNAPNLVVVVDAAHGGEDNGAVSPGGRYEKEFTLAVARRIQSLGNNAGIKVVLTRLGDVSMTLSERVSFSEKHKADIFISLHMDNDANPSKKGISCMIGDNPYSDQSRKIGDELASAFRRVEGITFTGLKQGNPFVLKNNTVPSVLVELGYLSNEEDLSFISKPENQQELAEQTVQSLLRYRKR